MKRGCSIRRERINEKVVVKSESKSRTECSISVSSDETSECERTDEKVVVKSERNSRIKRSSSASSDETSERERINEKVVVKSKRSSRVERSSSVSSNETSELESSDSSGADSEPLFFDDEERLPVHEWGLGRCKNVQEAANILLIEAPSANVSRVVPVNINKNVSFIIDTSAIDHIDDLKCDEMGSWDCVGVKSAHFRKKSAKVKKVAEKKIPQGRCIQIDPPLL